MKVLSDTSFMVALVIEEHPAHDRVLPWQQRIAQGEVQGVLAAHSLAEAYAVLTRIPRTPPIPPDLAWQAIVKNVSPYQIVTLTAREYRLVLSDLAARDIGGGPTYDALIAAVARKSGVDFLLNSEPKPLWACCA